MSLINEKMMTRGADLVSIKNTCFPISTLNMVDLVQALAQVGLGVQACQEGGPDMGGGGLACFAGEALA